ncbi:phage tail protein [Sphingomonas sp. SRS2]|uniref:phage tail protein n=1 Tax=Sphingomonas sp. SRS2 TaxID=133190 RepID=UPI00128B046C|nr:phage tail protein [Sphingomonas sp. SRS2]
MSKVLKPLLIVAAVAVAFIPGVGTALSVALWTSTSLGLAAAAAIPGLIIAAGAAAGLSIASNALLKVPRSPLGQLDRLNASVIPGAYRPAVFGTTALATDIRYTEPWGAEQEYVDYIIGCAAHKVTSIDEIWIEDRKAWSATGGVIGDFVGYLTAETRLEGTAANTIAINGGGKWGATRRLTGCAYIHLRVKRTGNTKKAESPFAGGLASRLTIRGKGMALYDPRRDSTAGGSGSMRANDQSTWSFAPSGSEIGNNTALQILTYYLGWRINGLISVGCGIPPSKLDMASFITAANLCDELVAKSAGGTEPRYRSAAVVTEGDDPSAAMSALLSACNGRLRDNDGRITLTIMHNDLAATALDDGLDDDDVLGPFQWDPDPALNDQYNIARGRYIDASDASLYQPVDYPEVSLASIDGFDRVLSLDLLTVESPSQVQRIAKQVLQRKQYDRRFTATFSNRAWKYQVGDPLPFTFSALGFDRALFRVEAKTMNYDGTCPMVLTFEHEDIYAWDASDAAPVVAADPTLYDPLNDPYILGIGEALAAAIQAIADAANAQDTADGKIDTYYQTAAPTGASEGDLWFDTDDTNKLYVRRSGAWVLAADTRVALAITNAAGAQATADGKVTTFYTTATPTATALGDLWYSSSTNRLRRWNGSTWVDVATVGANWSTNLTNIPTAISDGRVDAGLNSDGTIKTDRVTTLSVDVGALVVRAAAQPAGSTAGTGANINVCTINVYVPIDASVLITATGAQNYVGGTPDHELDVTVNGVVQGWGSSGGAGDYQAVCAAGALVTLAGGATHTIRARWRGGAAQIILTDLLLAVDAAMRNG